ADNGVRLNGTALRFRSSRRRRRFGGGFAPDLDLAPCHVLDRAAGLHGAGLALEQIRRASLQRVCVIGLDQQPVFLASLVASLHVYEMPFSLELAALQLELQVTLGQSI